MDKKTHKGRGAQKLMPNRFHSTAYIKEALLEDYIQEESVKTSFIPVYPKTIINEVKSPNIPMEYSLNPYQGCEHGCIYCYARMTHNYWGYGAGIEFETKIMVKQNAAALVTKAISKKSWKVAPIVLSGNTDCYQPIEKKLKITRSIIEVLHKHRHPVGFITKNALILRDLDLLGEMAADNLVQVNISISGTDEDKRRFLEPRTSSYSNRFRAIEKLTNAGIPVRVLAGPIIPGFNNHELVHIMKLASKAGAVDCTYLIVRLFGDLPELFADWVEKFYPDRAKKILRQVAEIHGGKLEDTRYNIGTKGKGAIADILRQQYTITKRKYYGTIDDEGNWQEPQPIKLNCDLFNSYKPGQLSLF